MIINVIRSSFLGRVVSVVLAALMILPLNFPMRSYALSGGPASPEYGTFQKVGVGNMVDPFTGDVQYSIPILEVGGYPINLTYSGNINPEQEAGWVGLGWSLQAGSIGRAVRGVPDDFKGEQIKKEASFKPRHITKWHFAMDDSSGDQVELFSLKGGLVKGSFPSLVTDNYRGFGLEYPIKFEKSKMFKGLDSVISIINQVDTFSEEAKKNLVKNITDNEDNYYTAFNFTTNYSAFDGNNYSVTPAMASITGPINNYLAKKFKWFDLMLGSPSMSFNTHNGLSSIGLTGLAAGHKANAAATHTFNHNFLASSYIPYFNPDETSTTRTYMLALSLDKGFLNGRKVKLKVTHTVNDLKEHEVSKQGFGYLYSDQAEGVKDVISDHQMSMKQITDESQLLPPTVATYDVFNVAANGIGGSFRVKYNSVGMISPPQFESGLSPSNPTIGIDLGHGTNWEIGGDFGLRVTKRKIQPWDDNDLKEYMAFKEGAVNDIFEPFALRNNYEFIESDQTFNQKLGGNQAAKFSLKRKNNLGYKQWNLSAWSLQDGLYDKDNQLITNVAAPIQKNYRDPRQQTITYLTASEAKQHGISKHIHHYLTNAPISIECELTQHHPQLTQDASGNHQLVSQTIDRISSYRKAHHLSEINILQPSGMLYSFGLPVYQIEQHEVSFSIQGEKGSRNADNYRAQTTSYVANTDDSQANDKGISNSFDKLTTPAYASSFLLTGIFSQDYSDLTNDGPTTDDLGTYVKFNYSLAGYTGVEDDDHAYTWRSPFEGAHWNRGHKSDDLDDMASYSYGKREQWYMHSIESKEFIVLFITADRADGFAALPEGGINQGAPRQRCLKEVIVYARDDFEESGSAARRIKTIRFHYSYDQCQGIANFQSPPLTNCLAVHPLGNIFPSNYSNKSKFAGGKLTLHLVEILDGDLGMETKAPYVFEYNTLNPDYEAKSSDRWGTYCPLDAYEELGVAIEDQTTLGDRPYVEQNKTSADQRASAWMLSDITLPSGAKIHLDYEADDYAYVQDKKAMFMHKVADIRKTVSGVGSSYLYGTAPDDYKNPNQTNRIITFELASGYTAADYIPEDELIYFSFNVNLARLAHDPSYEQVSGFFEVEDYGEVPGTNLGYIKVKEYDLGFRSKNVHPVTKMAWQYTFTNVPHVINPSSYTKRSSNKEKIGDAVMQAFGVIPEYIKSLTGEAMYFKNLGYAKNVNLDKCLLRLAVPGNHKYGGGHRVKKVTVSDDWSAMTGSAENEGSYSTTYAYTTMENGEIISSGVALWEPFVGGDENPHKMPIHYEGLKDLYLNKKKVNVAPITISYDLGPVGEEFYPAPGVGYSKVVISSDVPNASIIRHKAGRTEYEFYTAKDFPTKSYMTTLDRKKRVFSTPNFQRKPDTDASSDEPQSESGQEGEETGKKLKLKSLKFGPDVKVKIGFAAASQGFVIIQNDMHGKSKSVKTYREGSNEPISSTTYHYKVDKAGKLDNTVIVLRSDGTYEEAEMGVQIDPTIYSYRITEVDHDGSLRPDVNIQPPIVTASFDVGYHLYSNDARVMIYTKQVYQNGILEYMEVMDKGAKTYTKNLAWDPLTGKVLLSEGKDEFDDPVYALYKPAYWMNDAFEGAYKNINLKVDLSSNTNGSWYDQTGALREGDVLVQDDFANDTKYWVLDKIGQDVTIIDKDGNPLHSQLNTLPVLRVFRSGHQNLLHLGAESVVLKSNPLNPSAGTWYDSYANVISATALDYNETRHMLYPFDYCFENNCGYSYSGMSPSDTTSFGFSYLDPPAQYSSTFNYEYETVPESEVIGGYFGVPQSGCCGGGIEFHGSQYKYQPPPPTDSCVSCEWETYRINDYINPYVYGLRGIWRPSSEVVYYEKHNDFHQRTQSSSTNPNQTYNRQEGYIQSYQPYWSFNQSNSTWERNDQQTVSNPWTWKDSITLTDFYGNDLEAVSASNGIHNSVLYDYSRRVPVATASNARYHEVLFDGFEDYSIGNYVEMNCDGEGENNGVVVRDEWEDEICHNYRHWRLGDALVGGSNRISNQQAHTGNTSLMLGYGETTISFDQSYTTSNPTYTSPELFLQLKDFNFAPNFYLKPSNAKDYIISFWVKEVFPGQFDMKLYKNGVTSITVENVTAPITVNGWKKITWKFNLGVNDHLTAMELINQMKDGSDQVPVYLDDLMIYPANSVINAFVYDRNQRRLMARLNPNNFATYFEYNKQGNMIRQKVETDRGLMTLGESYQSFKD